MATTTTNFGWDIPQSTDLVKDGATAIAALGQDIDTAFVDLKGGTTGQVLAKASNTDLDYSWVAQDDSNAIQNAIVDAKGDLIAATANDTPARLAVGTNGHVLTADSAQATGLKWAAPAGGGKVLQVVQSVSTTATTIASTTMTDTGLSASITPTLATSKILIIFNQNAFLSRDSVALVSDFRILRDATAIYTMTGAMRARFETTTSPYLAQLGMYVNGTYLDSPATTSAITYKSQAKVNTTSDAQSVILQNSSAPSSITLLEIGA